MIWKHFFLWYIFHLWVSSFVLLPGGAIAAGEPPPCGGFGAVCDRASECCSRRCDDQSCSCRSIGEFCIPGAAGNAACCTQSCEARYFGGVIGRCCAAGGQSCNEDVQCCGTRMKCDGGRCCTPIRDSCDPSNPDIFCCGGGQCNSDTRRCCSKSQCSVTADCCPGLQCTLEGVCRRGIAGDACSPTLPCDGDLQFVCVSDRCCSLPGGACRPGRQGDCCPRPSGEAALCAYGECIVPSASSSSSSVPTEIGPPANAGGIQLLVPIGGMTTVPSGFGVEVIQRYLAGVWLWLVGIGVGIVLLRIVISGIKIMNSGGNPGLRTAAKDEILWAIVGLLILLLAGAILSTINPSAYGVR